VAQLERAIEFLTTIPVAHVVFVGDYVNRGEYGREVLELLGRFVERHPGGVTLLRGNHEQALLDFLAEGKAANFARHGGFSTIRSYLTSIDSGALAEFRKIFPDAHRRLIEATLPFYEDNDVFVSHAGFDPSDPTSRTLSSVALHGHPQLFCHEGPWPRQLTVCGHYVQRGGEPYVSQSFVCIDTGCGTISNGKLTVMVIPERDFYQF